MGLHIEASRVMLVLISLPAVNVHGAPSLGSWDLGQKGFTLMLDLLPAPHQQGLVFPSLSLFHPGDDDLSSSRTCP